MAGENGPNVEEGEDSKLGFELLLTDLRLEILARLCESVDSKAQVVFDGKMIRQLWIIKIRQLWIIMIRQLWIIM